MLRFMIVRTVDVEMASDMGDSFFGNSDAGVSARRARR